MSSNCFTVQVVSLIILLHGSSECALFCLCHRMLVGINLPFMLTATSYDGGSMWGHIFVIVLNCFAVSLNIGNIPL